MSALAKTHATHLPSVSILPVVSLASASTAELETAPSAKVSIVRHAKQVPGNLVLVQAGKN